MSEPNTINKALIVALTGDLVGSWGTSALNPNFVAVDGMLGGFQTFSLSAATTVALTGPSGSITPGAGPTQQQNALLRFTGTQLGTATYQFSLPGSYTIDNQCVGTTFPLVLAPAAGTGNSIGIPPGKKTQVFFDGTSMDFVSLPDPGTAYDLHGYTALPAWMQACTVKPYLVKDGTTYSTAAFPALAALLGSAFGGNGITTFAVPDERARMRLPVDTNGPGSFSNRVTAAGSNINGTTMGATGGDQALQAHTHSAVTMTTDPGHNHTLCNGNGNGPAIAAGTFLEFVRNGTNDYFLGGDSTPPTLGLVGTTTTGLTISVTNSTTGGGAGQNMPPTIVSFLPLIKT